MDTGPLRTSEGWRGCDGRIARRETVSRTRIDPGRLSRTLVMMALLAAAPCPAIGQDTNLQLLATQEWQDTGITLVEGDRLIVKATGRWSNTNGKGSHFAGGDGFAGTNDALAALPEVPLAALLGRIGDQARPFPIGARFDGSAPQRGRLFLAMNDRPGTYGDNAGSLQIDISVVSSPIPMPRVLGLGQEAARNEILRALDERSRMPIETTLRTGQAAAGTVIAQAPLAGEDLRKSKSVQLVLSSGPPPPKENTETPPPEKEKKKFPLSGKGAKKPESTLKPRRKSMPELVPAAVPTPVPTVPPELYWVIGTLTLLWSTTTAWAWRTHRRLRWVEKLRLRVRPEPRVDFELPAHLPFVPDLGFSFRCTVKPGNAGPLGAVPIIDSPTGDPP